MIRDYRKLAKRIENKFLSIKRWNDIQFDDFTKEQFKTLDRVEFVNDYSIQINTDKTNHTILPSQYLLYAVCLKELAFDVYRYLSLFDKLKEGKSANEIGTLLRNKILDYSSLEIDDYSKELAPQIFYDDTLNLGAKDIVNGSVGEYKIRGTVDLFGSIILKVINIPNASSSILGKFIWNLCENEDLYSSLEKKYIQEIPFVVEAFTVKDFCYYVTSFLYNYDKLDKFKPFLQNNEKKNNVSIKKGEVSLTSIFKKSDIPLNQEELSQGKKLRYYIEPLFRMDDQYVYFSTEWTNDGNSRLDLENYKFIIEELYPEFRVVVNESKFYLKPNKIRQLSEVLPENRMQKGFNKIYFGAPGTGKSYAVSQQLKDVSESQIERVIFHPDYDYSSFIGGYKPVTEKDEDGKDIVKYKFVPQVFVNIFERAHRNPNKNFYLVVEEINRGNCAEIFGDIFQLLDRNPDYAITPSEDLLKYLAQRDENSTHKVLKNGKIVMPDNLIVLATMNTSDQSLYPMDSAFKRRWDWQYVPIKYPSEDSNYNCPSFDFMIKIGENKQIKWVDFIANINKKIEENPSLGMDKCIGNFFVKPDDGPLISLDTLVNKVIFYLWNDVFKDEDNDIFTDHTYLNYFPIGTNGSKRIDNLIEKLKLNVTKINATDTSVEINEVQ